MSVAAASPSWACAYGAFPVPPVPPRSAAPMQAQRPGPRAGRPGLLERASPPAAARPLPRCRGYPAAATLPRAARRAAPRSRRPRSTHATCSRGRPPRHAAAAAARTTAGNGVEAERRRCLHLVRRQLPRGLVLARCTTAVGGRCLTGDSGTPVFEPEILHQAEPPEILHQRRRPLPVDPGAHGSRRPASVQSSEPPFVHPA
eukprot:scaffold38751_cov45-Phaeocystis_antarctica.AAC.2